jgi:hypothetical protein
MIWGFETNRYNRRRFLKLIAALAAIWPAAIAKIA